MTPVRLEPAAPWSRFKHSTTEQLRSLFFQTCLQRQHLKKRNPKKKNSKILRAKMGPRMLQNAPNCTIFFFKKNPRRSMPPYPLSMASRLLRSHANTLCFQYCAPSPPNMESWIRPCYISCILLTHYMSCNIWLRPVFTCIASIKSCACVQLHSF